MAIPVLAGAEVPTAAVRYSNIELATPAGLAGLHNRIAAAARAVCEPYNARDLARQQLYSRCYRDALRGGVLGVHSPALNAYHEARTGEHIGSGEVALKLASQALPSGVRNR